MRDLTFKINGKTYTGMPGEITGTTLGINHHGIFSSGITIRGDGSVVSVGGYGMDTPIKDDEGRFSHRQGTAYGLQLIMDLLKTVGVDNWEQLKGQQAVALFEGTGPTWGKSSVGIAHSYEDRALILAEHAAAFRDLMTLSEIGEQQ